MSLVLVSAKVVPVTLKLSLSFRDMTPLKGERELKAVRAKGHAKLLATGKFFTPIWGECRYGNVMYRGNGNHTSNLLTACMQQTSGNSLDERSDAFVHTYLLTKGGPWSGSSPADLPSVEEGTIRALVESFTASDEADLVDFFRRYDAKESSRNASDLLGIHKGEHADLNGIERKKLGWALAGVLRAAKMGVEEFGIANDPTLWAQINTDPGFSLIFPKIRQATRWIVETVPDEELYSRIGGAQVFAEVWAFHGEEAGELIVTKLMEELDVEGTPANAWYAAITNRRKKPTIENVISKGRKVVKDIAGREGRSAA